MDVTDRLELIKRSMPETYESIKRKADAVGNDAYADVRAGLRGEVNRFYAFEAGHVVGTPFDCPSITADIAMFMVQFGVRSCVLWSQQVAMSGQGAATGSQITATGSQSPTPSNSATDPQVGTPAALPRQGNSTLAVAPAPSFNNSPATSPEMGE